MKRLKSRPVRPTYAAVEDSAADWLARRDAGFTAEEQAEFEAWLGVDPRHFAAIAAMESAWARVNRPRKSGDAGTVIRELAKRERRRRSRRFVVATAATFGVAAALAFLLLIPGVLQSPPKSNAIVLRPERQVLADGSVVEFNASTEIDVAYTAAKRTVSLLRGEALFQVARDPARPFVVKAANVEVTALGTAFAIRHASDAIGVIVTEGRVTVERTNPFPGPGKPKPDPAPVFVQAGEQVIVSREADSALRAGRIEPAEIKVALAWRVKRIEFSGTSLADAVALFNGQNRVQLVLDPRLAEHRVSGIFWSEDPEGFARLLEASFPLRADREADGRIHLRKIP